MRRPTLPAVLATLALTLAGPGVLLPSALAQNSGSAGGKSDQRDRAADKGRSKAKPGSDAPAGVDPSWLDRMPGEDRRPLEVNVGFAPPPFADDLQWIGGPKTSWDELRGKVVVIQSWTGKTSGGRAQPKRTQDALKDFKPEDVVVLMLHTPEGADKAANVAKQSAAGQIVVVDPSGNFCDALGVFKRPVNVVVDRDGAVAYVGLSPTGLPKAVSELAKKPVTPDASPKVREEPKSPSSPDVRWPTFSDPVSSARDLRGKPGPQFFVADWLSEPGSPNGRMVLVDFFASWCGPCLAAVPHMNDLARSYGNDVLVVGVSDESKRNLSDGLLKRNRKVKDFAYPIGVDPGKKMFNAFAIRGIPHCAIMSTDGVVRWQGHPSQLTAAVMDSLVAAHRSAAAGTGGGSTGAANRWAKERK